MAQHILNKKPGFYEIYDMDAMQELSKAVNGLLVLNPGDAPFVTTDFIHQATKLKGYGFDLWVKAKNAEPFIAVNDVVHSIAVNFLEARA